MKEPGESLQWFQVIERGSDNQPPKVYGFAANEDDIILKAPNELRWMEGETLQEVRPYFIEAKATVAKVRPLQLKN